MRIIKYIKKKSYRHKCALLSMYYPHPLDDGSIVECEVCGKQYELNSVLKTNGRKKMWTLIVPQTEVIAHTNKGWELFISSLEDKISFLSYYPLYEGPRLDTLKDIVAAAKRVKQKLV